MSLHAGATTSVFKQARDERRRFVEHGRDRLIPTVEETPGMTTADLSRQSGVPPATTYSVLRAAEKRGELRSVKANACRHWYPVEASA